MFWYGNSGVNGWGYALMTVGMVVFWALVIVAIVALVRYVGRGAAHTNIPPSTSTCCCRPRS